MMTGTRKEEWRLCTFLLIFFLEKAQHLARIDWPQFWTKRIRTQPDHAKCCCSTACATTAAHFFLFDFTFSKTQKQSHVVVFHDIFVFQIARPRTRHLVELFFKQATICISALKNACSCYSHVNEAANVTHSHSYRRNIWMFDACC